MNTNRVTPSIGIDSLIAETALFHASFETGKDGRTVVGDLVVVRAPVKAGNNFELGAYTLVCASLTAGDNVKIGSRVTLDTVVELADDVMIQNGVEFKFMKGTDCIAIGKDTRVLTNAIIYAGSTIGKEVLIADCARILKEATIGDRTIIGAYAEIGEGVKIGKDVKIQSYTFIPMYCSVGDRAYLGPGAILTNTVHPRCEKIWDCIQGKAAQVEEGAIVGAGSILLPGSIVKKGAFVGAGSIVSGIVPEGMVYRMSTYAESAYQLVAQLRCKTGLHPDGFPYRDEKNEG